VYIVSDYEDIEAERSGETRVDERRAGIIAAKAVPARLKARKAEATTAERRAAQVRHQ